MSWSHRPGLSRRTLLAGLSAIPLVAIHTRRAAAAEFSFKLATGQSLTQPINARLEQACKRIEAASGGRIELKFFPASQLGSDTDLLTQVRTGGIDFLNLAGSVISTVASPVGITNVGLRVQGLCAGLAGHRRRARQGRAHRGREVRHDDRRSRRRQFLPPDHVVVEADPEPGRSLRLPHPRAGLADLHLGLPGARRDADLDQLQRTLQRPADQARRRPGERPGSRSTRASSTRSRNTSPRPTTSGTPSGCSAIGVRSRRFPTISRKSSPANSTGPISSSAATSPNSRRR